MRVNLSNLVEVGQPRLPCLYWEEHFSLSRSLSFHFSGRDISHVFLVSCSAVSSLTLLFCSAAPLLTLLLLFPCKKVFCVYHGTVMVSDGNMSRRPWYNHNMKHGSHFILRSNSINYNFCLNILLICCLLIVIKVVKFMYWVWLGM